MGTLDSTFNTEAVRQLGIAVQQSASLRKRKLGLPAVKISLVGVESSGKSSYVSMLLGIPVNHTRSRTSSRFPVRYHHTFDKDAAHPVVSVNGTKTSLEQLEGRLKQHAVSLEERGIQFDDEELEVQISSSRLPDLQIIDLPGLRPAGKLEEKEKLMEIHARFMRQTDMQIVVVLKCRESPRTMPDLELLRQAAIDPKLPGPPCDAWESRALFFVNHFNKEALEMTPKRINEFFEESKEDKRDKFYIVLKGENPAAPPTADAERRWWAEFKHQKSMETSGAAHWNIDNDALIGLDRADMALGTALMKRFLPYAEALNGDIQKRIDKVLLEEKSLKNEALMLEELPDHAAQCIKDFSLRYSHRMTSSHTVQGALETIERDIKETWKAQALPEIDASCLSVRAVKNSLRSSLVRRTMQSVVDSQLQQDMSKLKGLLQTWKTRLDVDIDILLESADSGPSLKRTQFPEEVRAAAKALVEAAFSNLNQCIDECCISHPADWDALSPLCQSLDAQDFDCLRHPVYFFSSWLGAPSSFSSCFDKETIGEINKLAKECHGLQVEQVESRLLEAVRLHLAQPFGAAGEGLLSKLDLSINHFEVLLGERPLPDIKADLQKVDLELKDLRDVMGKLSDMRDTKGKPSATSDRRSTLGGS